MSDIKKTAPHQGTATESNQGKDKEFFLLFDLFSGEIDVLPIDELLTPPFGCFVSHISGPRAEMERIKKQLTTSTLQNLMNRKIHKP